MLKLLLPGQRFRMCSLYEEHETVFDLHNLVALRALGDFERAWRVKHIVIDAQAQLRRHFLEEQWAGILLLLLITGLNDVHTCFDERFRFFHEVKAKAMLLMV